MALSMGQHCFTEQLVCLFGTKPSSEPMVTGIDIKVSACQIQPHLAIEQPQFIGRLSISECQHMQENW